MYFKKKGIFSKYFFNVCNAVKGLLGFQNFGHGLAGAVQTEKLRTARILLFSLSTSRARTLRKHRHISIKSENSASFRQSSEQGRI